MIKKPLRLVEAFAGYGSQRMALRNLGIEVSKDSKIIEWTIDAIIAYAAVHHPEEFKREIEQVSNSRYTKEQKIKWILSTYTLSTEKKKDKDKNYVPVDEAQLKRMKEDFIDKIIASNVVSGNLGSIMETRGEQVANMDLFTYSFPCQDLSLAGNMKGLTETSRSGLLFQVERILKEQTLEQRPKVLLLENVKNLVGKKFKPDFDKWINTLDELGYNTTWKVLDAKEHGVPQNRQRVFALSIKKDQPQTFDFEDIKTEPLVKRIKHYLEDKVDESFYILDEHKKLNWIDKSIEVISKEKILSLAERFNAKDLVIEKNGDLHFVKSDGSTRRIGFREKERNWLLPLGRNYTNNIIGDEIIPTIMTSSRIIVEEIIPLRIRKITPREALRLMGVLDVDINNIFEHNDSKGALYKLAGNSIVVDVLERIFKELYNG